MGSVFRWPPLKCHLVLIVTRGFNLSGETIARAERRDVVDPEKGKFGESTLRQRNSLSPVHRVTFISHRSMKMSGITLILHAKSLLYFHARCI